MDNALDGTMHFISNTARSLTASPEQRRVRNQLGIFAEGIEVLVVVDMVERVARSYSWCPDCPLLSYMRYARP